MRVDRIKEIRDLRGFSQEELAERCKLSKSQIFRIEAGKSIPAADTLAVIARELEVSTDYLVGLVDEPTGHFQDEALSPMERRLIWAYRHGYIVEALKALITSEEVDQPPVAPR